MIDEISSFSGEYEFLSNFSQHVVQVVSVRFPTLEHAYQAAKTHKAQEGLRILQAKTPGEAKRLGQRVTLREDWENVKVSVMLKLLRHKFLGNRILKNKLRATGDAWLVEGNTWGDNFWGAIPSGHKDDLVGQNWLGYLLMLVRAETHEAKF